MPAISRKHSHHEFDKNYLNELVAQADSEVFKEEFDYHLALHPAQLNDFALSVKEELGKKIARYDQTFKGILLGFEQLRLLSQFGTIGIDNLYVHFDVRASFFVFRPEIGMRLKGVVTQATQDHVGCLAYHTFNISLPKPVESDSDWLGYNASPGNEVEFQINFVDLNGRLPYIRGDIQSITLSAEETSTPKKKKKSKLEKDPELQVSSESLGLDTSFSNNDVSEEPVES